MSGNVHCNGHDDTDPAGDGIDPYHEVSRGRALCSEELISREISGDKEDDQASDLYHGGRDEIRGYRTQYAVSREELPDVDAEVDHDYAADAACQAEDQEHQAEISESHSKLPGGLIGDQAVGVPDVLPGREDQDARRHDQGVRSHKNAAGDDLRPQVLDAGYRKRPGEIAFPAEQVAVVPERDLQYGVEHQRGYEYSE